ncbi:MAG: hypothetical protein IPK82_28665 [Polyangiaceae bacterium]|nr:hypothetical protein [Polyangiaceae bacterium]
MSCLVGASCAFIFFSTINFGGTNHWVYDHGTADPKNTNNSWYLPALNLRSTVATMEHDMAVVYNQMVALRNSGQTAYVIPIWHKNLAFDLKAPIDGLADGVWGNVVDHSTGAMHPQHRANLEQLVTWAVQLGFERIVVRFFYNGDPNLWTAWDKAAYHNARGFIFDAREAAWHAFNMAWGKRAYPSHPVMLFDLGGEQAGINQGQMGAFIQTLWSEYTSNFGTSDTLGFSFAWAPGRFTTQLGWLSNTGVLPERWAFDIYDGMGAALGQIHTEMGPLRNQPIDIMETYFNDPGTSAQIETALDSMPLLNVDSLMQWPVAAGESHFTPAAVAAQNTNTTFSNYFQLVTSSRLYVTSDNADVMGFSNLTCGTGIVPCNVDLHWEAPPPGHSVGIYVQSQAGHGLVACPGEAGSELLDWVHPYYDYEFKAYHFTNGCPDPASVVGLTPVAKGRIHF